MAWYAWAIAIVHVSVYVIIIELIMQIVRYACKAIKRNHIYPAAV